jgi:hypothetical protein
MNKGKEAAMPAATAEKAATTDLTLEEFLAWVQEYLHKGKEEIEATAEVAQCLEGVGRTLELVALYGGPERLAHDIWRKAQQRNRTASWQDATDDEEAPESSNGTIGGFGLVLAPPYERPEPGEPYPDVVDPRGLLTRPDENTPLGLKYWCGSTFRWVRLGEMTKEMCLASADFYGKQARGNAKKQTFMVKLAEALDDTQTVADCFSDEAVAAVEREAAA